MMTTKMRLGVGWMTVMMMMWTVPNAWGPNVHGRIIVMIMMVRGISRDG